MRYFQELAFVLSHLSSDSKNFVEVKPQTKKYIDQISVKLFQSFPNAKFIVNDGLNPTAKSGESDSFLENWVTNGSIDINPPFKTVWVQCPEGKVIIVQDHFSNTLLNVCGVLLEEMTPGVYFFCFICADTKNGQINFSHFLGGFNVKIPPKKEDAHWIHALERLLRPFSAAHAMGVEKTKEMVKYRVDGEKICHKIRHIVHVVPKTKRAMAELSERIPSIDWSHRWAVRGHWRECEGVGKDRDGQYCVSGFTWVLDHIKGPEDLPFVEKTRVVHRDFFKPPVISGPVGPQ